MLLCFVNIFSVVFACIALTSPTIYSTVVTHLFPFSDSPIIYFFVILKWDNYIIGLHDWLWNAAFML